MSRSTRFLKDHVPGRIMSFLILLMASPLFVMCLKGDLRYYDQLRKTVKTSSAAFSDANHVGRNLHRIDTAQEPIDGHDSLLFCHVPMFFKYSNEQGPDCQIAYSASVGAMLALHHFNTGDGTIVPELEGINERCDIRLTTEIVDTGASPINAVKDLTRMLARSSASFSDPQPCVILGSLTSPVTSKLASLTGVYDLFQVSPYAISEELENPTQYPLFARTHTDVAGFGGMSISYLVNNLGIRHFGLLSPNDAYGNGFQQSVLKAAARYGISNVVSSQYLSTLVSDDEIEANIRESLITLKKSGYNYVVAAFYPELFTKIMGIAYEMGLAGDGQFWIISGTGGVSPIIRSGKLAVVKDSPEAKAILGNGLILCEGGLAGIGGSYDRFIKEWLSVGETKEVLEYMNEKQPPLHNMAHTKCNYQRDLFEGLPQHDVTFTYDAVVGIGLAACGSQQSMTTEGVFSGKMQRDFFAQNPFRGSSGDVLLRDYFPTRTADSVYFAIMNLASKDVNSTHITFKGSPLSFVWETEDKTWQKVGSHSYRYPGQSLSKPPEFQHPEENFNYVNNGLVILGMVMFSLQALATVMAIAWMIRNRKSVVVRAGQPEFLALVAIGCLMVSSAILPLSSAQGEYRFERDSITLEETDTPNKDINQIDAACMAVPWLACIGFVLIYSALLAKLCRILEIMTSAQQFQRAEVPKRKVAIIISFLLGIIISILLSWQLVSPLRWEREITEFDPTTGYPTDSVGRCTSEHFAAFASACACFICMCLAYALIISYKTRTFPSEFSESKYIAASVGYLLQLLVLGVPILVIAYKNKDAHYVVLTLILFLMSFGTTLLIFIPKVISHRKRDRTMTTLIRATSDNTKNKKRATSDDTGNKHVSAQSDKFDSVEQIKKRIAEREAESSSEIRTDQE